MPDKKIINEVPQHNDLSDYILKKYNYYTTSISGGKAKLIELEFDEIQRHFLSTWNNIYNVTKPTPKDVEINIKKLIEEQPDIIALTLAICRTDNCFLFDRFKRFLEFVIKPLDDMGGRIEVISIPHVQAGFLYMTAAVFSLYYESWEILTKLLTKKFEWYYQSGRPLFSYGFDLEYFFHSEALKRGAHNTHDFYREELGKTEISLTTGIYGENLLDIYLQAQMLMCIKAAQLIEIGENVHVWADFGRFYKKRVIKIIDRIYADEDYAKGVLKGFDESSQTFITNLNGRLKIIRQKFWGGTNYFWDSVSFWEPR
ncbi:MAG: hypothetical protein HOC71_14540 [Candidatus Latescibacteria bacterium]|nr:hypothetical protein [Candidatus Latescibacterota bacterium]